MEVKCCKLNFSFCILFQVFKTFSLKKKNPNPPYFKRSALESSHLFGRTLLCYGNFCYEGSSWQKNLSFSVSGEVSIRSLILVPSLGRSRCLHVVNPKLHWRTRSRMYGMFWIKGPFFLVK